MSGDRSIPGDGGYRGGDATYHRRHGRRTLGRAEVMASQLPPGGHFLDAGCNRGLTSAHLLERGAVERVTGIELARSTVDDALLADPRFAFIEGNLCDIDWQETYDHVFYGAVHHHILRERGLSEAVRVLQHLVSHCRRSFYFETGHITEGGRWAWQRALRRYFRTDEEHLFYLLRCVEEQVEDFDVAGRFWIHGARRWLLRLDLKPLEERRLPTPPLPLVEVGKGAGERLGRTFGSRHQQLLPLQESGRDTPVELRFRPSSSGPLFLKRALHSPLAQHQELTLGLQLNQVPWAVPPIARTEDGALAFPRIEGDSLLNFAGGPADLRRGLAAQLLVVASQAARLQPEFPQRLLLPASSDTALADVVDLNPNNLLVETGPEGPRLRVVDFEPQGNHYRWKNRLHLGRTLLALGHHRPRALGEVTLGILGGLRHLLRYQLAAPRHRLLHRQPNLGSVLVAETRSRVEGLLARLIPRLDEL
ncbi:MAG: class I SAM-dependent methyltransferase [Acidobacteriota bacterium]|nr:class I SAM-dependent methyltransferase [Acidobacteriota bacterium]